MNGIGRNQRQLPLALLEQHRGIGPGDADRHLGFDRGRSQDQPLGDRHLQQPANVGVGHLLLLQEGLHRPCSLNLPSSPLVCGRLAISRIDQPLRQDEAMVFGKGNQCTFVDQRLQIESNWRAIVA